MLPIATTCRALAARRPLTQPTRRERLAISISRVRVASGTCASVACRTIGASVPSMSSSTAEREGSERSGSSASTKRRAAGDTVLSMTEHGGEQAAQADDDRYGGGPLQRDLRRGRRLGDRAAARAVARLRGA